MYKVIYDGSREDVRHKIVFARTIEELAKEHPELIYLDADLMNSSGTYDFWHEHPDQAINCGVAEANMMGIAGGLSAAGRVPYVHTFGPFATRRCFDQVFLSIGYAGNSVRIYGSDAGVSAEFNGGTHMPFEDMALMRAIPGSGVFDVADGVQLAWLMREVYDRKGVTYFRSARNGWYKLYEEGSTFEIGKGNVVREGTDITVMATGLMIHESMVAADELEAEGISVRVVDMFSVKPIDKEMVWKCAEETGAIVTAENHNVIGGLGDAVGAALLEKKAVPFKKVGVEDRFGQVGPMDFLQKEYGLTADNVAKAIRDTLARKD